MKFDTKKWKDYVEEYGDDYLIKILENKLISINWSSIDWVDFHHYLVNSFNPLLRTADFTLFTALGLNIEDFIIEKDTND